MGDFSLPFWKVSPDCGAIWYYCTLCHCFEQITLQERMNGVIKYSKKNTSSTWSHVLHGHAIKFTSFLSFLYFQNNSQPDDASEISMDDGSRNQRKADEVSVGSRLSYYLLLCHPYGDKHSKQRKFEINIVALMAHAFMSLLLVDNDFPASLHRILTHAFALLGDRNCCGISFPRIGAGC